LKEKKGETFRFFIYIKNDSLLYVSGSYINGALFSLAVDLTVYKKNYPFQFIWIDFFFLKMLSIFNTNSTYYK